MQEQINIAPFAAKLVLGSLEKMTKLTGSGDAG